MKKLKNGFLTDGFSFKTIESRDLKTTSNVPTGGLSTFGDGSFGCECHD